MLIPIKGIDKAYTERGDDLLRVVRDIIAQEPKRGYMGEPVVREDTRNHHLACPKDYADGDALKLKILKLTLPPCGTVGCIAGWTDIAISGGYDAGEFYPDYPQGWGTIQRRASSALNLTYDEKERLFYVQNWCEPFKSRYLNAKRQSTLGKVIVDRIDYFLKHRK